MRYRIIATLVFFTLLAGWWRVPVFADKTADLQAQLVTAKGEKRLRLLEEIFYQSLETDDQDFQYRSLSDLIAEARRQKDVWTEINAMAERSVYFYNNAMDDSVLTVSRRYMVRMKELDVLKGYYELWGHVANTYVFMGKNNIAIRETKAMFEEAKLRNDKIGMGLANSIMGQAYSNLHSYDQSIEAFEKAVAVLSSIAESPAVLPDVYVYYGEALNDKKDYVGLEQLTIKWHAFLEAFINEHHLAGTATGDIYWAYYYLACAQADLGLRHADKAAESLEEAHRYIKGNMETQLGGKWLYCKAQLAILQGRYLEALNLNSHGAEYLLAGNDSSVQVLVGLQKAEILEGMGRYAEAARQWRETYQLHDSLNAQEIRAQVVEMNSIFQVGEKELENERLQHENENAQNRFIIIVISVIVVSLAVFLFFRIRSARRLKQAHTELQTAYSDLQAANEVIEETTAAKERIESELRIARDIQQSMVPAVFPDRPDLDLYASMTPAKEVGGDMYSYLLIETSPSPSKSSSSDLLYFAVGDVSGKGVPASLFMAQATRLFHTLAKQLMPPAEIATRMNAELAEDNEQGMFITMFIGLLDLSSGHLSFCNAGHNPPVILSSQCTVHSSQLGDAQKNCEFLDMLPNAPIGLWPELDYEGEEIADISGRPLFVYTDGLNEAENPQQEQFTDERLLQLLGGTPFEGSQQTIEMLKAEVERHRDGADPNDDLTMMCVCLKNQQTM